MITFTDALNYAFKKSMVNTIERGRNLHFGIITNLAIFSSKVRSGKLYRKKQVDNNNGRRNIFILPQMRPKLLENKKTSTKISYGTFIVETGRTEKHIF